MVYSVYGLMGRVESLDREAVLDALDLPADYPKDELVISDTIWSDLWLIGDKNNELVAIVHKEEA
jgi:hypothetical protein